MKKGFFQFSLLFILAHSVLGQNNQSSLGIKFGVPVYHWNHNGSLSTFRTINSGVWSISANFEKEIKNDWWGELDFTVNRLGTQYRIANIGSRPEYAIGYQIPVAIFQLNPSLLKNLHIHNNKIGIIFGGGISFNLVDQNTQDINDPALFGFIYNGATNAPIFDMSISDSKLIVKKFSTLIRVQSGITYNVGKNSKFSFNAIGGINPGNPIIVKELNDINFEGQHFEGKHILKGNYYSLMLGYIYKIN